MPPVEWLGFAFLTGTAACFNPCGFALLPGYLAYFVGRPDRGTPVLVAGARAGAGMAAGVLAVFTGLGALLSVTGRGLLQLVPLGVAAVGVAVAGAGVFLLVRPAVAFELPTGHLLGSVPDAGRGWLGFTLFGVAYGVASLGCALPLFLVVVTQALVAEGPVQALGVFVAYGLGMGTVLLALALAAAAGKAAVLPRLRGFARHVRTAGAAGMILAGGYLVYAQLSVGVGRAVGP